VRYAVLERLAGQLRQLRASLAGPETFWRRGLAHAGGAVTYAVLERLAGQLRRLHASLVGPETFWGRGLAHEVGWWERWIVQKGRRWPDEFRDRLDPETPLREELIVELLPSIAHDPVRILDVGAGPVTSLGKVHPERTLEIVAVDPLADEYAALWRNAGIRPPVPAERGTGERLVERFGTAAFDIAYARNALDHMIDPLAVVEQMLEVVRDTGYVVLRHSRNEATKARYRGLHQWNIALEGSDLVVRRPRHKVNLSAELAARAVVMCRLNGETVTCVISKRPAPTTPPDAPAEAPDGKRREDRARADARNRRD